MIHYQGRGEAFTGQPELLKLAVFGMQCVYPLVMRSQKALLAIGWPGALA